VNSVYFKLSCTECTFHFRLFLIKSFSIKNIIIQNVILEKITKVEKYEEHHDATPSK
jgi:hypothetical protein